MTLHNATASASPDVDRFQRVMESTGVGMAIVALDGRIVEANPALAAMLGATPAEARRPRRARVHPPDDLVLTDGLFADLLEGRRASLGADKRFTSRATAAWSTSASTPPCCAMRAGSRCTSPQMTDVSEQRRAERELQALNATLEARVAARTRDLEIVCADLQRFAYGVSHDLRAVAQHRRLRQVARRRGGEGLDEQGRDYLRRIREARGADGDAHREPAGTVAGDARRIPFRTGRRPACSPTGPAPNYGTPSRNGPRASRCSQDWSRAATNALKQLFSALLHNAWEFSRERERVRIEVAGTREGEVLRVDVRDHGIGYDPRYADKLFQCSSACMAQRKARATALARRSRNASPSATTAVASAPVPGPAQARPSPIELPAGDTD